MVAPDVRAAVHRPVLLGLAGLGVAALCLIVQWAVMPRLFAPLPFPSNLVAIAVAALAMWLDRRAPRSSMAAALVGGWSLIVGLWVGQFGQGLGSGDVTVLLSTVVLIASLVAIVVCGVLSTRSEASAGGFPRRIPRLLAAGGMLLDAVGDALPEGLHPDGPGPVLFLMLAVVTAAVPSRAVVAVAGVFSLSLLAGGWVSTEGPAHLVDPSAGPHFAGAWMQLVGQIAGVLFAVLALVPVRRAERAG